MSRSELPESVAEAFAGALGETVPGLCIGSLRDGVESYATYGVRSVEDPVPVNADTLFRVASISKLVTGMLLSRLQVSPERAVREYLPDFQLADAAVAEQLTVRDLLTHRSGFASDYALDRPAGELDEGALARAVADLATSPQIYPLRRFYSYSNAGFVVLARIAEVVAGEPYELAARRLVFEPAGMERSTFFTDEAITYPVALGHGDTPARIIRPWGRSRARNGVGGLMTTARELIGLARQLSVEPQPDWQPLAERSEPGQYVGVAWQIRDIPGIGRAVGHPGLTRGFASRLTIVPDSGRALVILANSDRAGFAIGRATDAFLGAPAESEPEYFPAPDVADYLGGYTDGVADLQVTAAAGGVVLKGPETVQVRFIEPDEGRGGQGQLVRFIRDDAAVGWLRIGDRILRKVSYNGRNR
jgi:CubicO group peptidase (beta-lactamase class C family)